MKAFLKKYGLIGGTAVACAACCAAPVLFAPLLAWLGVAGVGSLLSPWFLLFLVVPVGMLAFQIRNKQAGKSQIAQAGTCGWESPCKSNERKNHGR